MSESNSPKVTIMVVPRESHSFVLQCIEHIYAFTPQTFQLIVIDPNGPKEIAEGLRKWEKQNSNCKVLRSEHFIFPYEAKNWAVKHLSAETEWVVFIDNDVKVSPHWLSSLLSAANETGARVFHPLYLLEVAGGGGVSIHMADGTIRKGMKNGTEHIQPVMNYVGLNICNSRNFIRKDSGFLEFHAFMIRRDLLDEMGEFEPVTLSEDVNYSLRLLEKGERVIFEPNSVITYVVGPPFEKYDLPYYRFRWDPKMGIDSTNWLKNRWRNVLTEYWTGKVKWMHYHRQRIEPWFPIVSKYLQWVPYSRTVRKIGRLLPVLNQL